jgi:beta-phosphoglucomutase-like phosphatase (HAD superfamily)
VAVEDTPAGVAAARGVGLRTVAVAHTCSAEDLAAADRVVARIAELSADDLLADSGD